jgi:hypothetical protein
VLLNNTGPETDTFHVTGVDGDRWTIVAPADVTLDPGQNATVTVPVTVGANGALSQPKVAITSLGNPLVSKSITWRLTIPTIVTVAMDPATTTGKDVTGNVTVTYLDGTPAANALVTVTQTPTQLGTTFSSTVRGRADASGVFHVDFGDVNARAPGHHDLVALALARTYGTATLGYDVAVTTMPAAAGAPTPPSAPAPTPPSADAKMPSDGTAAAG